ncbi:MAG: dihydropteroate synthase [Gammaproteobacteria bacterium]|nr:MAG: dihydropteroate synthase [Gammaproteobacteria bacterium]
MGVLNVTPDSFYDGGRFLDCNVALRHAEAMVAAGADLLDVGGESTRPGAEPTPLQAEMDRVLPVVEALVAEFPLPVSVDTSKPELMRAAAAAGAAMINDVLALRAAGALETAAELGLTVCLMHMQGEPRSMQRNPVYADVVREVRDFLAGRIAAATAAGLPKERLLVDPGFGFGKSLEHNLRLLAELPALQSLGCPVLVGLSRKSLLGKLLDRPVEERLAGSLALALLAAQRGAAVLRVHDVAETLDVLRVLAAVEKRQG